MLLIFTLQLALDENSLCFLNIFYLSYCEQFICSCLHFFNLIIFNQNVINRTTDLQPTASLLLADLPPSNQELIDRIESSSYIFLFLFDNFTRNQNTDRYICHHNFKNVIKTHLTC